MSVDFLRLQCVRGALPAVCRTVEALVAENGWKLLPPGSKRSLPNFYKEVYVREESGWIVVDAGEGHSEPWAERIASSLGTTGIKLTSYTDGDVIELARYDADRCTKHISHRCDAQRRPVRLPLAFLSDLVPTRRRPGLRRGVLVSPLDSDSAIREIARLAGMPKPLAAREWLEEGRLLRFEHPPPPRLARVARAVSATRPPGTKQVSFEESFHIRRVDRHARGAIERAMKETLAVHDFVPVPANADPVTWAAGVLRVFVHAQHGALSLGEMAIDDGRAIPSFKWAEILSRKLDCAVLAVWREGGAAEATLWLRGTERGRVALGSLSDEPVGSTIDASALAEFAPTSARARLRSIRETSSIETSLQALGDAFELSAFVLAGELEGTELRFRRSGSVDHKLYQVEQSALDWAARAPNVARLSPLFRDFADLTPEKALRDRLKPARRV